MTAATKPLLSATEAEFQNLVVEYAQIRGWLVMHTRPARTEKGWRTAIQGVPGFPDLVLVRAGRMVVAELKSEKGQLSPAQRLWREAFIGPEGEPGSGPGSYVYYLWRPSDWETIKEVLA